MPQKAPPPPPPPNKPPVKAQPTFLRPPAHLSKMALYIRPDAYMKLRGLCMLSSSEIGGFAITNPGNPFYIEDLWVPQQRCDAANCDFVPESVSERVAEFSEKGYNLNNVFRIWWHTHPGDSPDPSHEDLKTFHENFGPETSPWMAMLIMAKNADTYALLRGKMSLGGQEQSYSVKVPLLIDWTCWYLFTDDVPEESIGLIPEVDWEEVKDTVSSVLPYRHNWQNTHKRDRETEDMAWATYKEEEGLGKPVYHKSSWWAWHPGEQSWYEFRDYSHPPKWVIQKGTYATSNWIPPDSLKKVSMTCGHELVNRNSGWRVGRKKIRKLLRAVCPKDDGELLEAINAVDIEELDDARCIRSPKGRKAWLEYYREELILLAFPEKEEEGIDLTDVSIT